MTEAFHCLRHDGKPGRAKRADVEDTRQCGIATISDPLFFLLSFRCQHTSRFKLLILNVIQSVLLTEYYGLTVLDKICGSVGIMTNLNHRHTILILSIENRFLVTEEQISDERRSIALL